MAAPSIRRLPALAALALLAGSAAATTPAPAEAQALAARNGCMACHGLVDKRVGPGFAQVAGRYRDDPAAPAQVAERIRNGSVGQWGRVIMPRQPQLSEATALLLARWVLAQPTP